MTILAHISDPHFGTEDPAVLAGLLADLADPVPSLVVLSGDLTQRARTEQFAASRKFLEDLPCPFIVVPGNHDVPLYNVFQRFLDPLGKYKTQITSDLTPVYSDDHIAVAGIATAHGLTAKGGKVTPEQVAATTAALAKAGTQWKIVAAHHPFVAPENAQADLVEGAEMALEKFRGAGVNVILTGHLHIAFFEDNAMRDDEHRVVSVHAGTCISTRTRGEPNNYNRLVFEGDELAVVVRAWTGTRFEDTERKVYRRRGRDVQKLT